jgi:hypothetical protein
MLRSSSLVVVLGVLLVGLSGARAEVGDHTGGPRGGGVIVGDTPVAVAVTSPSGTVASYTSRARRDGARWTCGYYGLENGSSSGVSINIDYSTGPVDPIRGQGYGLLCTDQDGQLVYSWLGVYDPADPFSGLMAAERAAELALEALDVPAPVASFSPTGAHLVGLRSWMWVDTQWAPSAASATVTGVTSTVTATPRSTTWDMGDGTVHHCDGPGVPFDADGATREGASPCTHVYTWPSASHTDGAYVVTATVTYTVEWHASTGEGGDLGTIARSTSVPLQVVEVQAVIG